MSILLLIPNMKYDDIYVFIRRNLNHIIVVYIYFYINTMIRGEGDFIIQNVPLAMGQHAYICIDIIIHRLIIIYYVVHVWRHDEYKSINISRIRHTLCTSLPITKYLYIAYLRRQVSKIKCVRMYCLLQRTFTYFKQSSRIHTHDLLFFCFHIIIYYYKYTAYIIAFYFQWKKQKCMFHNLLGQMPHFIILRSYTYYFRFHKTVYFVFDKKNKTKNVKMYTFKMLWN